MPKLLSEASIRKQIAALQARLKKSSLGRTAALRSIVKQMKKHALTLDDVRQALGARVATATPSVRTRAKAKVKYRDENGNTWSGRGVSPRWLVAAEAKGRKREEFLV
jgi:DNA-binding protein H-NS